MTEGTYSACTIQVGGIGTILTLGAFIIDTTSPTVTINKKSGQSDPTLVSPILYTAVFSEAIDVSTFTR